MKTLKILAVLCVTAIMFFALSACAFRGASAYEIAVRAGYTGTEQEWLSTLKGDRGNDGADGKNFNLNYTAYDLYSEAKESGEFDGTFLEFVEQYLGDSYALNDAQYAVNASIFSACSVWCRFAVRNVFGQSTYSTSAGSGVIYSVDRTAGDALIITNYHVVYSSSATTSNKIADEIYVYLYGGERVSSGRITCQFVGGSSQYDLALLKVTGSDVIKKSLAKSVNFADSDEIALGQSVVAIGNPEAEGISVTKGIISVESEDIAISDVQGDKNTIRVLRYDAAVNPGNSGGGLFDMYGNLIGIVNAKTADDSIDDMNYAIPSNTVKAVVAGLERYCLNKSNEKYYRTYIGVTTNVIDSTAFYNQEKQRVEIHETVIVESIVNGGLAYGKFAVGDRFVSVKIGDTVKTINRSYQIIDCILSLKAGDVVVFTVLRDGETKTIEITVTQSSMTQID